MEIFFSLLAFALIIGVGYLAFYKNNDDGEDF